MNRKLKVEELNRLSNAAYKAAQKIPLVVVLDNIRSGHNVGAVFRTADAFLVEKIYLCGITPHPPHKEISKTALGATESVAWEKNADTLFVVKKLKSQGYSLIGIEQVENSVSLNSFTPQMNKKIAVIFGNEVFGVNQDVINICDTVIEIPQYGTKHSLNISVSAGIIIWDLFNKVKRRL